MEDLDTRRTKPVAEYCGIYTVTVWGEEKIR